MTVTFEFYQEMTWIDNRIQTNLSAEVMKYDDLIELGSEAEVKKAGKWATKGKDYIVLDGDICHYKIGQIKKK